MPSADPARSAYCAARHLLRRLGNERELRRNLLVLKCVGRELRGGALLNAAQGLVDRAFSAMDSDPETGSRHRVRHSAILLRCDVLREPRAAVARDLGISVPQFERERRRAMGRFLEYLASTVPQERAGTQFVQTRLAHTVRDRAMRLADSGDRQSALTLLDAITATASPPEKIAALIGIAEIEAADHATNRSRAALDSAKHLLSNETLDEETSEGLRLNYEAAFLRLRTVEAGPQAARKSLRLHRDLPRRPESIAFLIAQAEVLDGCGMARACRPFVSQAAELQNGIDELDPGLRFDIAMLQCQLAFWLDPGASARTGLDNALADVRSAGYLGRAAFAELSSAGGQWAAGDVQARRSYRALLRRIAESGGLPRQTRFFAFWDAADVECGIGDPWRAADAARNALVLAPNAQRASLIHALLARAYARGGRPDMSERIALDVVDTADAAHSGTALLSAKRTLAFLASKAGRAKDTWEHLTDAADLAHRYGTARVAAEIDARISQLKKRRVPSLSIVFASESATG